MTSLYQRIIADESRNADRIRQLSDAELTLFNEAMELEADAFEAMGESLLLHDLARGFTIPALLIKSFTHLRAIYKLVLCGYFAEIEPLIRGVMESVNLACYFHQFPEKSVDWAKGTQYSAKHVSEAIQAPETQRKLYSWLSNRIHPNVESVMALIDLPLEPNTRRLTFYIPADASEAELREIIGRLAMWAFSVVTATGIIYKELLEDRKEWWRRYSELKRPMEELRLSREAKSTTEGEEAL